MKAFGTILTVMVLASAVCTQQMPSSLRSYLNRNFRGWELAGECYPNANENKRVLFGDFNGDGKKDYAVKFIRGSRGFFLAFLAKGNGWQPHYLHILKNADEAKLSDLSLFKKGEDAIHGPKRLRYDAPGDFRCESDVGGVHVFRNGKFIAY